MVNEAILSSVVKELAVEPEEGMWLDKTKTQLFLQNAGEMISQHTQHIFGLRENQEEEKEEEDENSEESEEHQESKEDEQNDKDDEDDGTSNGHPTPPGNQDDGNHDQEDRHTSDSEKSEKGHYERKETRKPGKQRQQHHGLLNEDPVSPPQTEVEGSEPPEGQEPMKVLDALKAQSSDGLQGQKEAWWAKKDQVLSSMKKLRPFMDEILRLRSCRDVAGLLGSNEEDSQKIQALMEAMKIFLSQWPGVCPHNREKCQLPEHPACIQVLQSPPQLNPEEMGLHLRQDLPVKSQSLALHVELLLGNQPKYRCMDACRQAITYFKQISSRKRTDIQDNMQMLDIRNMPGDSTGARMVNFLRRMMPMITRWLDVTQAEVHFLETVIEKMPDPPAMLYAMAPPVEALPMFYPVLEPLSNEPLDDEEFEDISKDLKRWRETLDVNCSVLQQTITEQKGKDAELISDLFMTWARHQKALQQLCNKLLQARLVNREVPRAVGKGMGLDAEVQKLAESLLKARIRTNRPTFESWLATAYWCTQQAVTRIDKQMELLRSQLKEDQEYMKARKQRPKHMFEQMSPVNVTKTKPHMKQTATDFWEELERKKGEPYDTSPNIEDDSHLEKWNEEEERERAAKEKRERAAKDKAAARKAVKS